MLIKSQKNLQPSETSASQVVIENDQGMPIVAAFEVDGSIVAAVAGDKDFQAILKMMGIKKVVPVYDIQPKSIDQLNWIS